MWLRRGAGPTETCSSGHEAGLMLSRRGLMDGAGLSQRLRRRGEATGGAGSKDRGRSYGEGVPCRYGWGWQGEGAGPRQEGGACSQGRGLKGRHFPALSVPPPPPAEHVGAAAVVAGEGPGPGSREEPSHPGCKGPGGEFPGSVAAAPQSWAHPGPGETGFARQGLPGAEAKSGLRCRAVAPARSSPRCLGNVSPAGQCVHTCTHMHTPLGSG